MTLSTTTIKKAYTGNNSTTIFAYDFRILADGDLLVTLDGVTQSLTTHYTVSGAGDAGGGNVTFVTAPGADVAILIKRNLAQTQSTDYVANDPFPAESHETALDRAMMIIQELQEVVDRAALLPVASTLSLELPDEGATTNALKMFSYDSSGTQLELVSRDGASPITTKGDIQQGDANGNPEKLTIGSNHQGLGVFSGDGKVSYSFNFKKGADIASATALPLGNDGNSFDVTGTTTVTSIGTVGVGALVLLRFDGALILTHDSANLILPRGANITTIAGDTALFHEYAAGDWRLAGWGGHTLAHTHADAANGGVLEIVNDTTPQLGGPLDTNSFAINESEGATIADSGTPDIFNATDGNTMHLAGTTTITDFPDAPAVGLWRKIIFDGIRTLTHGSGITVPGGANITTAANDYAFVYADAVDAFTVLYFRADGTAVVAPAGIGTIPVFSVHKNSTNQTGVATGTSTKITWSTEDYDTNSDFASNAFTPTVAGKYLLLAVVTLTAPADGSVLELRIRKNNTTNVKEFINTNGVSDSIGTPIHAFVEANGTTDFFEIFYQHNHGSDRVVQGVTNRTYFQGFKIAE